MGLPEKLLDIQGRVNKVGEVARGQAWLAAKNAVDVAEELIKEGRKARAGNAVVVAQDLVEKFEKTSPASCIDEDELLARVRVSDPEAYTWIAWAQGIISQAYDLTQELITWDNNDMISIDQSGPRLTAERDADDVLKEFGELAEAIEIGGPVRAAS